MNKFIQNEIKIMAIANGGYDIDFVGGSLFVKFIGSNTQYKANVLQSKLYNWFNKVVGTATAVHSYKIGNEGYAYDFI